MKSLSLLVLLPVLLACSPQPEQATEKQAAPAHDSHATDASAPDAHASDEHASVESTGPARAAPAGGWVTDAPLREGMGRIRLSVDALAHYEQGHMGAEQAVEMAGNVEKDVNFLIANCKLDPDADAALHEIIAQLLKGSHALKSNPADLTAISPMREAVAEYSRSFDDPAFRNQATKP